jgi:uncharacterized protein (DUF1778 family)
MPSAKKKPGAKSARMHSPDSRLNFRLAREVKDRVARAAALTGQDLTEFAVAALNEKACEVIEQHDHLLLESDDYQFFLGSLGNHDNPRPSKHSRLAAERYKAGKRKGVGYQLAD